MFFSVLELNFTIMVLFIFVRVAPIAAALLRLATAAMLVCGLAWADWDEFCTMCIIAGLFIKLMFCKCVSYVFLLLRVSLVDLLSASALPSLGMFIIMSSFARSMSLPEGYWLFLVVGAFWKSGSFSLPAVNSYELFAQLICVLRMFNPIFG